jgi:putative transposase
MSRTRLLIQNACYHIYARGNQKQAIFRDKPDFEFYLHRLKHYKRKYAMLLYGYCLMPNHIHLIGKPRHPDKLPKFMQCLQRSYSAYYNKKYNKVGHLWQGRFKMKTIAQDQYMLDCIAYVEQNPIRANLAKTIGGYEFSSYAERALTNMKFLSLVDKLTL